MGELRKPVWTSSSFLLYAGAYVVLTAVTGSLTFLHPRWGWRGLTGWVALELVVLAAVALALRRTGRWLAAGVLGLVAAIAWGILCGVAMVWFGGMPATAVPITGSHPGLWLVELLALVGAVVARRVFRHPLHTLLVVAAGWLLVVDVVSNGGNWSATVTILYGLLLLVAALVRGGRTDALWLHVGAAFAIGGALVWFWHTSYADWALVASFGVIFVSVAALLQRSSWAVVGAYGLLLAEEALAGKWATPRLHFGGVTSIGPPLLGIATVLTPSGSTLAAIGDYRHPWTFAVTEAVLGFLLVALGLLLERRDPVAAPVPAKG